MNRSGTRLGKFYIKLAVSGFVNIFLLLFLHRSVTKRVWSSAPAHQRPFRVCSHDRGTRKGITAGTLEELREKVRGGRT